MHLRAMWRLVIAIAAVVFVVGGSAQAQPSGAPAASAGKPLALGKYVKHRSSHARKSATRHSRHSSKKAAKKSHAAQRSAKAKRADAAKAAKAQDAKDRDHTASVRKAAEELSAVADARAEMKASEAVTPFDEFPADGNAVLPTSETLSDLDRAAAVPSLDGPVQVSNAAAPVNMVTAAPAPEPPTPPVSEQVATSHDDVGDTWDKTSLIGKIFVAFGGLLTLASAARMFMA